MDVPVSPRFGFCMTGHIIGDGSYLITGGHRCDSWKSKEDKVVVLPPENNDVSVEDFCWFLLEYLSPKFLIKLYSKLV